MRSVRKLNELLLTIPRGHLALLWLDWRHSIKRSVSGDCMKSARVLIVAAIASLAAACSSTPSKQTAPPPPAAAINVAGNWTITVDSQFGSQDAKMSVKQEGSNLSGTMESPQ